MLIAYVFRYSTLYLSRTLPLSALPGTGRYRSTLLLIGRVSAPIAFTVEHPPTVSVSVLVQPLEIPEAVTYILQPARLLVLYSTLQSRCTVCCLSQHLQQCYTALTKLSTECFFLPPNAVLLGRLSFAPVEAILPCSSHVVNYLCRLEF